MDGLDLGATIRSFTRDQKVFGRYTLIKTIGRGGMGIVWLARDEKLERDVALKFLPEIVAQDARAIEDLKKETRRSLELTHPNIVRIYDFIDDARAAAISMEYVAGDNLSKRGAEQPNRIFPLAELRPWVKQLCDALTYAHNKAKIVHLDLKPANLMLDASGDLKVADFGIAANISDSVSRVTQRAGSSGTPVYMSPQQMMGEPPAVTDDIYALGATLYELLTGRPPFYTGNIGVQVSDKVAPPVNERRRVNAPEADPVPPAWQETIAACLAKKAEDRPQSAHEVWERLNAKEASVDSFAKETAGSQETGVANQKAVPLPVPAKPPPGIPKQTPHAPVSTPPAASLREEGPKIRKADEPGSGSGAQKVAKGTDPVPAPVGSSRSDKSPAKAVISVTKNPEDKKPTASGLKPGGKLVRRGILTGVGVAAAVGAVALVAFARFGNPIYMPVQVYRLAESVGNPRILPPVLWASLCRAWDTWLIDLKNNAPRLLRTEALWEEDDPLRRQLADFVATSNELLPATLVPAAASEKRLAVLAGSPSQAVLDELQTDTVRLKVFEALQKVEKLAVALEQWPRWNQLRSLQQVMTDRGFTRFTSALQSRLPPRPGSAGYKLDTARTLKLFNDLSLDDTGTLWLANRWSEIAQLSADMAASGDRVQRAMPAILLQPLTDTASLGDFAASLTGPLNEFRLRRWQFLETQVNRERFLKESVLQKKTTQVTRADILRWEKELGYYPGFSPAVHEKLQALGIYTRVLRTDERIPDRIFVSIPEFERPRESYYEVAEARFENETVEEVLRLATSVWLIGEEQAKLDEVARSLAATYNAFSVVSTRTEAADFRAYLESSTTASAQRVRDYIKSLHVTLQYIEWLGLTPQELAGSKAQIYGSILRARLNAEPEFLQALVEGS